MGSAGRLAGYSTGLRLGKFRKRRPLFKTHNACQLPEEGFTIIPSSGVLISDYGPLPASLVYASFNLTGHSSLKPFISSLIRQKHGGTLASCKTASQALPLTY